MRLILAMPLMAAAVAALGACGQSDETFKATYRNELVTQCSRDAARGAPAGVNVQGLCTCMIDRYVANTPVDRLKTERGQTEIPAAAREAMMQCAQEEMRRQMGGATGATPATPAPATEAPAAPAETPGAATENESE
jgi:hypothetical protein